MKFSEWLSKIKVYHGSKYPIHEWDISKHLSGYYPGFYTWRDPQSAYKHGQHVYELEIDESSFYQMKDSDLLKRKASEAGFSVTQGSGYQDVQYLKSMGYDGIIRGQEYIVFDPKKWSESPIEASVFK